MIKTVSAPRQWKDRESLVLLWLVARQITPRKRLCTDYDSHNVARERICMCLWMPDASSLVNVISVPATGAGTLAGKKESSSLGILIWRRVMHSSSQHAVPASEIMRVRENDTREIIKVLRWSVLVESYPRQIVIFQRLLSFVTRGI